MIEIGHFVHWLSDREQVRPLLCLEPIGADGDGLITIGLAVYPGRDEVAQPAAPEEIAQAFEPLPVPREKYRARAGLAVVLGHGQALVARDIELTLHDPVRPSEVNKVGNFPRP